ncbi:copper chaperone PCu(A)C [Antarctobacter heliothermus]|uniref:Copper chaperone PCu(A)C n=1 Tax=Antarctobacter heliothermus TaxID=74033 RepID=A0A222EAA9_9RHOB|nr:copper chaperone PCu(A)C [Antarctobacter heliothermus]ASP23137.1 copper chaperone PCu(A)C [Antarctobacter heliothermus]
MTLKTLFVGAVALALATPVLADIVITDPYARSSGPTAKAGAAFMVIENTGTEDDRLIGVSSEVAVRVELHTHKDMGEGVMRMMEVEEGFAVPAGGTHMLQRGGDHVMFMGLNGPMEQGKTVAVTLIFEKAGEMVVDIPVDLERKPMHHMGHGMGASN